MKETRPRGRPRESALDERILEATLRLLAEVGYAHMSYEEIAMAAHTTRATIYLRYSSKAVLATTAIAYARRSFTLAPLTGDTRLDLLAQLRHFQESMDAPYSLPLVGVALAEAQSTPELLAALREYVISTRREGLRAILQQAQARSELEPSTDIELAVAQLIGSYYALSIAGKSVAADWPERVVGQLLAGIAYKVPPS
ncbi:MAG TPA: TetR/AcrR family transcriptional regulator [Ktedonobacteraceae bacterium]